MVGKATNGGDKWASLCEYVLLLAAYCTERIAAEPEPWSSSAYNPSGMLLRAHALRSYYYLSFLALGGSMDHHFPCSLVILPLCMLLPALGSPVRCLRQLLEHLSANLQPQNYAPFRSLAPMSYLATLSMHFQHLRPPIPNLRSCLRQLPYLHPRSSLRSSVAVDVIQTKPPVVRPWGCNRCQSDPADRRAKG